MVILKQLHDITDKEDKLRFLLDNRKELMAAKKAMGKTLGVVHTVYSKNIIGSSKALNVELAEDEFFIVGNSIGFFDSHRDVSMRGSWDKTVKERGGRIPILKDHRMSVDSLFAENLGTSIQEIAIRDLGYDMDGETQVVGAKIKPIDETMLYKYQNGLIKEHSVGLRYEKIQLAVNDPNDEDAYKVWTANIDKVINKQDAIDNGYFWAVFEQNLREISAVALGSNPFTPALKSLTEPEPQPKALKVKEPIGYQFLSNLNSF